MTVAKEVELEDPVENMGAQLVKEAATKTNDGAGDGTTTATLLTDVIVTEGLRNVTAGANPLAVRRGIEKATEAIVDAIKTDAIPVEGKEQIANVGTISAGDEVIGTKIAEAMEVVGKEGVISVEESQTFGIDIETVEGIIFSFDKATSPRTWLPIWAHGSRSERPVHPAYRPEDFLHPGSAAGARGSSQVWSPAAHHR